MPKTSFHYLIGKSIFIFIKKTRYKIEGTWEMTDEEYIALQNENYLYEKITRVHEIKKEKSKMENKNKNLLDEKPISKEKIDEENQKIIKNKKKYLKMENKKGRVEIKFNWWNKLLKIDKIDENFIPLNLSLFLNKNELNQPNSDQLNTKNQTENISQNPNSIISIYDDNFNTNDNPNEKVDTDTDSNTPENSNDSSANDPIMMQISHSDKIKVDKTYLEQILKVEKDLKLDNKNFTYDNPSGINKVIMEVKLYDNMYEDEHRMVIFLILNFENSVNIEDQTSNAIINDSKNANQEVTDNGNDPQNELINNIDNETSNQDTQNNNSEDNPSDNASKKIKKKVSLAMNMRSGVIEPNFQFSHNINNLSSYNFYKYFKSFFKGNLKFNQNLFQSAESSNGLYNIDWKTILTQNLSSMKDVMELKLTSIDPDFPLNIKASLNLKEDNTISQTFYFLFMVVILGICIYICVLTYQH